MTNTFLTWFVCVCMCVCTSAQKSVLYSVVKYTGSFTKMRNKKKCPLFTLHFRDAFRQQKYKNYKSKKWLCLFTNDKLENQDSGKTKLTKLFVYKEVHKHIKLIALLCTNRNQVEDRRPLQ